MMVPHCLSAEVLTVAARKDLEAAYHRLRTASEQLEDVESEICRLLAARIIFFPNASSLRSGYEALMDQHRGFGDHGPSGPNWSGWWQRATHTGLLGRSVDNLDRELKRLRALRTKSERIQSDIRCDIHQQSHPYLRKLNILDFPHEMLLSIFELAELAGVGVFCVSNWNRADMRNIRLVCRRFCAVSSQLLVRDVLVNFDEASLAQLEEMSRHPTIAKGVHSIRIRFYLYNRSFLDFERFISHHADILTAREEQEIIIFDPASPSFGEHAFQKFAKAKAAVVSTLRRLASADPDDSGQYHSEHDNDHRTHLRKIHQQYLVLLENQESLIGSGRFSRTVGSAMARMPRARKLEFRDWDFNCSRGLKRTRLGDDIWATLYDRMLQPTSTDHVEEHNLERPDYQCLVNTIDSVRSAGAFLDSITIDLSTFGAAGTLVLAPDIRQKFSSGMRQLKNFEFTYSHSLNNEGAGHLTDFLSACLDTSSLTRFRLDLRGPGQQSARINVGNIIGLQSRHELTKLFLGGTSIELSALMLLLQRLPDSMGSLEVYLHDLYLLSGTWKEASSVAAASSWRGGCCHLEGLGLGQPRLPTAAQVRRRASR
jgi:hypothetical protein